MAEEKKTIVPASFRSNKAVSIADKKPPVVQIKSQLTQLEPALKRIGKAQSIGLITFDRSIKCFPLKLSHEQKKPLPQIFKDDPLLVPFMRDPLKV